MFARFFAKTIPGNSNEQYSTRRRFSRRSCDHSVAVIDGQFYPVENWSMGGLAINGDARCFSTDQDCIDITLKFRLSDTVVDIPHKARIVRKNSRRIALEFAPLTTTVRRGFQNVIDDYVSSRFAESQLA